jgi:hypothetical protein
MPVVFQHYPTLDMTTVLGLTWNQVSRIDGNILFHNVAIRMNHLTIPAKHET